MGQVGAGPGDGRNSHVTKIAGVDRAAIERLDQSISEVAEFRPDLLGVLRIWTGPTACIDVSYFSSEADARAAQRKLVPPALQPLMAESQKITRDTG